uniref:Uncharacterized protein n=1 Tax=Ciona intestinalis TaxID=7719 RepID=H2Y0J2_CIOIN
MRDNHGVIGAVEKSLVSDHIPLGAKLFGTVFTNMHASSVFMAITLDVVGRVVL